MHISGSCGGPVTIGVASWQDPSGPDVWRTCEEIQEPEGWDKVKEGWDQDKIPQDKSAPSAQEKERERKERERWGPIVWQTGNVEHNR